MTTRALALLVALTILACSKGTNEHVGWRSTSSTIRGLKLSKARFVDGDGLARPTQDEMGIAPYLRPSTHTAASGDTIRVYEYEGRLVALELFGRYEDVVRAAPLLEPVLPAEIIATYRQLTAAPEPSRLYARVEGFTLRLSDSGTLGEDRPTQWSVIVAGPPSSRLDVAQPVASKQLRAAQTRARMDGRRQAPARHLG